MGGFSCKEAIKVLCLTLNFYSFAGSYSPKPQGGQELAENSQSKNVR